ncbi:AhpD-like protein [Hyaloraphidium curvatum]|nr:AhpD-like protein [Hyaloraphidium curvatum]
MTRITLLDPEQLPEALKTAHDDPKTTDMGKNYLRVFGQHPALLSSYSGWYLPWATSTAEGSVVPQRTKELCRLRIATLNGCKLCKAARMAPQVVEEGEAAFGVDHLKELHGHQVEGNGNANGTEGPTTFTEAEVAAIMFAEKMCVDHHNITDDDVQELLKHYDEKQFLELSMMIGQFMGYGRVLAMLQLENNSCPMPSKKKAQA